MIVLPPLGQRGVIVHIVEPSIGKGLKVSWNGGLVSLSWSNFVPLARNRADD
jgi:hypothetical protein